MSYLWAIVQALWLFIPAYIANPSAVLFGGKWPVDGGRTMKDGARLLGDGKTWSGTLGGIAAGLIIGTLQLTTAWTFGSEEHWGFGPFPDAYIILFLLPAGALLGDMLGSFIKRRRGRARGAKSLGLDQFDFVLGALIVLLLFQREWLLTYYWRGEALAGLIFILILTPMLHKGVNVIGYKMGKKDVPW